MSETAEKIYTKMSPPIVGTYKQYSAKNTNAGLDWSYCQISPDFTLYYAKGNLVGFIYNEKVVTCLPNWTLRGSWQLRQLILDHAMRVIASKYDIELEDRYEMELCLNAWSIEERYIQPNKMPYLLQEVMKKGELNSNILKEIHHAHRRQFQA